MMYFNPKILKMEGNTYTNSLVNAAYGYIKKFCEPKIALSELSEII